MIEFNNPEDQKIWACLEDFDLESEKDIYKLKISLYLELVKSIGYCGDCKYFNKINSSCNLFGNNISQYERCPEFERKETDTESAFEIMSEEFKRDQENLSTFAKIRKYQRMPRKQQKKTVSDKIEEKFDDRQGFSNESV